MAQKLMRTYDEDKDCIKNFIKEFNKTDDDGSKRFTYMDALQQIASRNSAVFQVSIEDVETYDPDLASGIIRNTVRYQKLIAQVVDSILLDLRPAHHVPKDVLDIFIEHRIQKEVQNRIDQGQQNTTDADVRSNLPDELLRRYEVYFRGAPSEKPISVRNVLANNIGHLIQVRGIVTRATEVKPLMRVATYTCGNCGSEVFQEINNPTFMPLTACNSSVCKANGTSGQGQLQLQTKGSRFMKFQEIRIQELSEQVPVGNIPRGLTVFARGVNTRKALPGDHVLITGVFLPSIKAGFGANSRGVNVGSGLLAETFLEVHSIEVQTKTEENILQTHGEDVEKLRDPETYTQMAKSIAPEIFGHEDIKKALLLLLVGGTELTSGKGSGSMRIRGNLNICLMGDPGVAKSQLLSFVDRLSPRSQYTTGRGSSGVGLTASVMKDPITGEMTLEGGALVLADQGVCCIDEFDKMAEGDRTAIHEVMEQQTISIAKAGILTTLNARVAILAAANPAYGRYNPNRTIEQNVDLPAALLSRFDLLWLVLDKPDYDSDLSLANHITYVHSHGAAPREEAGNDGLISINELRHLLAVAKAQPAPVVPAFLSEYLVDSYVGLRNEARDGGDCTYTSARTLLAMMRMSTALARLHGNTEVTKADIDETMRLMEASRASVKKGVPSLRSNITNQDRIYKIIVEMFNAGMEEVAISDVMEKAVVAGFKNNEVQDCIKQYERMNLWLISSNQAKIRLIA
ncbi:Mcm2-7 hexameric complex component [Cichlidogyrus casuarinus]|uniref:DNA replication licensing factor MCM7 n=1 Tax=Cichlidogyrus casuarinus TaxID=1844966 RepID=A0ABD2QKU3_9PLAT